MGSQGPPVLLHMAFPAAQVCVDLCLIINGQQCRGKGVSRPEGHQAHRHHPTHGNHATALLVHQLRRLVRNGRENAVKRALWELWLGFQEMCYGCHSCGRGQGKVGQGGKGEVREGGGGEVEEGL